MLLTNDPFLLKLSIKVGLKCKKWVKNDNFVTIDKNKQKNVMKNIVLN